MTQIGDRIMEGGPTFMIPLVLIMLTILVFFLLAMLGKKEKGKTAKLIGHFSLFGMVWGFLGSTIGLIVAFDAIDASGAIAQPIMAGGLKVALLTTVFGLVTFLIGRFCIIVMEFKS